VFCGLFLVLFIYFSQSFFVLSMFVLRSPFLMLKLLMLSSHSSGASLELGTSSSLVVAPLEL
jgi:hypothetical protein